MNGLSSTIGPKRIWAGVLLWGILLGWIPGTEGLGFGAESAGAFKWAPFLAPFHTVTLHFPIAFVSLLVLLDVYYLLYDTREVKRLCFWLMYLSLLSTILVVVLGILRGQDGGYDMETLESHRWFGVATGVFLLVALIWQHVALKDGATRGAKVGYRIVLLLTMVGMVVTGHQGGNLTHGTTYLTKNAPPFMKQLLKEEDPMKYAGSAQPGEQFFLDQVKPIFEAKCFDCHGEGKRKGGFRLDQRATALAAGDSGLVGVEPFKPLESNLVRLMLLPEDHEEVMPPAGKAVLSSEEKINIIRWIHMGAPMPGENIDPENTPAPAQEVPSAQPAPKPDTAPESERHPDPKPPVLTDANGKGPDFSTQVRPILEQKCIACHGPDKQKGKLRLDTLAMALKGGSEFDSALVAGNPDQSSIIIRISIDPEKDDLDEIMPPTDEGGPLKKEAITILREWIQNGAYWPEGLVLKAAP